MDSLEGTLLVASPRLPDPNFARSVVLIIQHGPPGAFGLILNQRSDTQLKDLWQRIEGEECPSEQFVAVGGPVDGPLLVLHGDPTHADGDVIEGVFVSSEKDNVKFIVDNDITPFRVFTGYSGWGAGQLETELEIGGWLQLPATSSIVFEDNVADLWQHVVHKSGEDFFKDTLGIDDFPEDTNLN